MVTDLFLKQTRRQGLTPVTRLKFSTAGIVDNIPCSPLRQVLVMPRSTIDGLHLVPGDLRENMIVDFPELHALPSGTVLRVGAACVRLTFHCEPCGRVTRKASASALLHNRGYLGQFLNAGTIALGDDVAALGVECEPVPYPVKQRIQWFLERQAQPIFVTRLLFECGIPVGYARAMPRILQSLPSGLASQVVFKSHLKRGSSESMPQLPL